MIFEFGFKPGASTESTFEIDGADSSSETVQDISAEVLLGLSYDLSWMRIISELSYDLYDAEAETVEPTPAEQISYTLLGTYGIDNTMSVSGGLVRNSLGHASEFLGRSSTPRTGLAMGFAYEIDYFRAGAGFEYLLGGVKREVQDEENSVEKTTELTSTTFGLWVGSTY